MHYPRRLRYPAHAASSLLATDHVTEATRRALETRLDAATDDGACAADSGRADVLTAVCARLVAADDRVATWMSAEIERRLASGESDGWRYDALPPDAEAYVRALECLDRAATRTAGRRFAQLPSAAQDALLTRWRAGELAGEGADPLAFVDMLAECAALYMSLPAAYDEIGYAGFADRPAWRLIGLGELDPREPAAIDGGERP